MEEIQAKVEKVLEKIRPYLICDGGDVRFNRYEPETKTLVVDMLGNCENCPLSVMTLRAGIEKLILKEIPEIKRVEKK